MRRMLFCMRTTLNLDDDLIRQLKAQAAREGRTLTSVIEDALRTAMALQEARAEGSEPFEITPFAGDGLQPGVDLDDSSAVLDLMDAG
jgi:hypothetical protein